MSGLVIKSTRVGCAGSRQRCAQSSIGINKHETRDAACVINGRTVDVVDKAPVTYLAKTAVHTGVVADDDVVIHERDTIPGVVAHTHMTIIGRVQKKRVITEAGIKRARGVVS